METCRCFGYTPPRDPDPSAHDACRHWPAGCIQPKSGLVAACSSRGVETSALQPCHSPDSPARDVVPAIGLQSNPANWCRGGLRRRRGVETSALHLCHGAFGPEDRPRKSMEVPQKTRNCRCFPMRRRRSPWETRTEASTTVHLRRIEEKNHVCVARRSATLSTTPWSRWSWPRATGFIWSPDAGYADTTAAPRRSTRCWQSQPPTRA